MQRAMHMHHLHFLVNSRNGCFNTFGSVKYEHQLVSITNHLSQPPQEPSPRIFILIINNAPCDWVTILIVILCRGNQQNTFVWILQKCTINTDKFSHVLKTPYCSTKSQEQILEPVLPINLYVSYGAMIYLLKHVKIQKKHVEAFFRWTPDKTLDMLPPPSSFIITDFCFKMCEGKNLHNFQSKPFLTTKKLGSNLFTQHRLLDDGWHLYSTMSNYEHPHTFWWQKNSIWAQF